MQLQLSTQTNGLSSPGELSGLFGVSDATSGSGGSPYLDYIAKIEKSPSLLDLYQEYLTSANNQKTDICGRFAVTGRCEKNYQHHIARVIRCGREWCPICGKDKSDAHRRRYGRLVDKAQQMRSVGVLVLTWPVAARAELRTQAALSAATKAAKKALQAHGYVRGIARWHWFGTQKGNKIPVYHPHLNLLFDAGPLPAVKLEQLKTDLRAATGAGVIHYSYADKPGKIMHTLRYITRATFLRLEWDKELGQILKGFRNVSYWGLKTGTSAGHWSRPPAWTFDSLPRADQRDLQELEKIFAGECPICRGRIAWSRVILDGLHMPRGSLIPIDDKLRYFYVTPLDRLAKDRARLDSLIRVASERVKLRLKMRLDKQ